MSHAPELVDLKYPFYGRVKKQTNSYNPYCNPYCSIGTGSAQDNRLKYPSFVLGCLGAMAPHMGSWCQAVPAVVLQWYMLCEILAMEVSGNLDICYDYVSDFCYHR